VDRHLDEVVKYDPDPKFKVTRERTARDPNCVRLIGICDPHFSIFDPPAYKMSYWNIQQEAIEQVLEFGVKKRIDAILWAGDIFHLKSTSRNPTKFLTNLARILWPVRERDQIEMMAIAGNHDVKFGSLLGLEGQPLELMIETGIFTLLDYTELLIDAKNFKVRIAGGSYFHGQADHVRNKKKANASFLVALGHFWFGSQTGEIFGEKIFGPDYLNQSEVDLYLIGHHHEDQGVIKRDGKTYVSPGSMSKTGAHKNDLTRKPAVSLIEITKEGARVTIIRPKYPPVETLLDLERREQIAQEAREIERFIEYLHEADFSLSDPKEILKEMKIEAETRERTKQYLEDAEEIVLK